jgi:hypothetical protein
MGHHAGAPGPPAWPYRRELGCSALLRALPERGHLQVHGGIEAHGSFLEVVGGWSASTSGR